MFRNTKTYIDLGALKHNVATMRACVGPQKTLAAVVKADAYGHGAVMCSRAALEAGASLLCVAIPEEALTLREAGISAPILILGAPVPGSLDAIINAGVIQTVFTPQELISLNDAARRAGKTALAELKIDTGMNRIGVKDEAGVAAFLDTLRACKSVTLHGAFTHFAAAEDDDAFTAQQDKRLESLLSPVVRQYPSIFVHAANSASIFLHPYAHRDGVRMGIALYGIQPAPWMDYDLMPVLSWKTCVAYVKPIAPGESVGYGRAFITDESRMIATLPVGYGDGYPRALGGKACVLIRGKRAPIVGRVCMDQIMCDVTGIDVCLGDEAVLIGHQDGESITAQELASAAGTIPYEITLAPKQRVPRVYIYG